MTGQPRSELREKWGIPEHLAALDDDVDKIIDSMNSGFDKIANQLERNRRTWQWMITTILGVGMFVIGIIALLQSV